MLVSNKICTCYTHGLDMFVDYVLGDDLRDFGTFGCFWTIWDDVFVRVALGDIHNQIHPELHPTLVWLPHRYYSLNFTSSWLGGRLEYMSIQSVRCPWNFMVKLNDNNHTFARYFDSSSTVEAFTWKTWWKVGMASSNAFFFMPCHIYLWVGIGSENRKKE